LDNQGILEELSKKNLDINNEFEIFWNIYPRKVAKKAAELAFARAAKHTPVAIILSGAARYAKDPNRVEAYTAHAATWLNAHRWSDEPLPVREKTLEEKKAEELRLSKEKELREREEARKYWQEQEAARAAVFRILILEARKFLVRAPDPQREGAEVRIERADIAETRWLNRSLMPAGLVENLPDAQARDLLAYLKSLR
jgi:hypothetical protein